MEKHVLVTLNKPHLGPPSPQLPPSYNYNPPASEKTN